MTGTRMEVRTLSDIDRINGEGSDRSFWKVLIDNRSRSELVDALFLSSIPMLPEKINNPQPQEVDIDQLPDLDTLRNHILDHLSEESLHIPPLADSRNDPLHPLQPIPIGPALEQL